MKKTFLAVALLVAMSTASKAQTNYISASSIQTTESVLTIDKTDRPAIASEYNIAPDALKDALKDAYKAKGIKLEKSKGLLVAKGVAIPEMGNGTYDLYFDVDSKSRSEKDKSVVKMAISSGYDNFIGPTMPEKFLPAKTYVASTVSPALHSQKLQADISAQNEAYAKAQKKYSDLIKEGEKLEKQRKSIEGDIATNKRDQDLQQKEIERQKAVMDQLKATEIK